MRKKVATSGGGGRRNNGDSPLSGFAESCICEPQNKFQKPRTKSSRYTYKCSVRIQMGLKWLPHHGAGVQHTLCSKWNIFIIILWDVLGISASKFNISITILGVTKRNFNNHYEDIIDGNFSRRGNRVSCMKITPTPLIWNALRVVVKSSNAVGYPGNMLLLHDFLCLEISMV